MAFDVAQDGVPLTVAEPARDPVGAVIIVQEAFGVTAHIADVCERAAAAGYLAVAPHLFHRSGDPVLAYDDIDAVRPYLGTLDPDGLTADLDAALGYLAARGLPAGRVGVVGFCMGGTVALWAGTVRPLGAAVSFYGGGVREGRFGLPPLVELAGRLQVPWLGLYGDRDTGIPVDQVEQLRVAAAGAAVPTELVRYPHGQHGFHCDARPAVYDAAAAADGWRRTLAWLAAHLA